jgi:hypothetical protein
MSAKISPGQTETARKAHRKVSNAINGGRLIKSHICELCGFVAEYYMQQWKAGRRLKVVNKIVAHHHRGYEGDAAMDIWFICRSCNLSLGDTIGISREEARKIINKKASQKNEKSMNITKALQIIQDHPAALALSVIITDDGMIDASVASVSPAGDMETLASHLGPGSIEGAIIVRAILRHQPFVWYTVVSDETPQAPLPSHPSRAPAPEAGRSGQGVGSRGA